MVRSQAQTLHLNPGEQPRDSVWGAGMIEETLQADVLVAGGGSAGTSAALAAARSGAMVVLVNGRPVLGQVYTNSLVFASVNWRSC